jgi:dTMP kinase
MGAIVLCDRYAASTRAYQGFGLGIPMNFVDDALSIATDNLEPDLTLLFDLDPAVALARRSADPASLNNLDMRDLAFRERVRNGYLVLAAQNDSWRLIDASEPLDSVIARAWEFVNNLQGARQVIR